MSYVVFRTVSKSTVLISIAAGSMKDMLNKKARRFRADVLVTGRSPQAGVLGRL